MAVLACKLHTTPALGTLTHCMLLHGHQQGGVLAAHFVKLVDTAAALGGGQCPQCPPDTAVLDTAGLQWTVDKAVLHRVVDTAVLDTARLYGTGRLTRLYCSAHHCITLHCTVPGLPRTS